MDNNETMRLQVYLAQAGIGSRRGCESFIEEGRITVNGTVILSQGQKVDGQDEVRFDGRLVKPMSRKIYIALHKPSGYICSNSDPDGRPLVKELFESAVPQRLFNVGRLDYMTSGLIFFTNDGEFAKLMTHPSSHLEKEYVITTKKPVPQDLMDQFLQGIYVEGEFFKCKEFAIQSEHRVRIILEEGKNRELRKVFQSANISIKKVHRIRIGHVTLNGLLPGRYRNLSEKDVEKLIQAANDKESSQGESRKSLSDYKAKKYPGKRNQDRPGDRQDRRPGSRSQDRPGDRQDRRPGSRSQDRPVDRQDRRPGSRPQGRPGHRNSGPVNRGGKGGSNGRSH